MDTNFTFLIFQLGVLIFSVMIHEISHGYVAERLGDDTAKAAGRLTLNPIKHIDPFGSIILPLLFVLTGSPVVLGWAKPVPYNPFKLFKDFKYGPLKVALAGPASNLLILIVLGLAGRFGGDFLSPSLVGLFVFIAYLNTFLAVFNLLPIPPLDGSKILPILFPKLGIHLERIGFMGIFIVLIFLMLFANVLSYISGFLLHLVAGSEAFSQMLHLFSVLRG